MRVSQTPVIPVDDRPHGMIRQRRGESRGRWEGDTPVVETTNFAHSVAGASREATLIERFRRVSEVILEYEYTFRRSGHLDGALDRATDAQKTPAADLRVRGRGSGAERALRRTIRPPSHVAVT